jgi:hypothetical protein
MLINSCLGSPVDNFATIRNFGLCLWRPFTPLERWGNVGFTAELLDPRSSLRFCNYDLLNFGGWIKSDVDSSCRLECGGTIMLRRLGECASGHGQFQVAGGGGAGGDYAKSVNLTGLTPGGSVTYRVGAGQTGSTGSSTAGGDSWFNDTAFPTTGQRVGAKEVLLLAAAVQVPATRQTTTLQVLVV